MRLIANACIIAMLATLCIGCSDNSSEKNNRMEFYSLSGTKVFVMENSAHDFGRETDVAYRDSVSMVIPDHIYGHDMAVLRDSIMEAAFDTITDNPADALASFYGKNVDCLGYTPVEVSDSAYHDDVDGLTIIMGNVFSLTTRRMTYHIANYTYNPGAAHGMESSRYITYDIAEEQIVTLADLFTAEGLSELPRLIAAKAKALESAIGPTNVESLPSDGNFYVSTDDEIVFVYQPYEVASYAQGIIHIAFYPYQLSEYLTPQGLNFFGMAD